jgi:hypothetical protein
VSRIAARLPEKGKVGSLGEVAMKSLKMIAMGFVIGAAVIPAMAGAYILPGGSFDECLNWCDENVPGPSAQNMLCHAQCAKDYPQGRAAPSHELLAKLD